MTKTTRILLAISLTSLLISPTGVLWGLFLPIGAIFFGLFMISNMLAKEVALFDEEQRLRTALVQKNSPPSDKARSSHHDPALRAAHFR